MLNVETLKRHISITGIMYISFWFKGYLYNVWADPKTHNLRIHDVANNSVVSLELRHAIIEYLLSEPNAER